MNKLIICSSIVVVLFILFIIFLAVIKRKNEHVNDIIKKIDRKNLKTDYVDIINTNLCNIPIYFINMNRSKDRLESVKKQINFYKINNIFRVEGIDGTHINNKRKDTYTFSDESILNFSIIGFNNYSKGELGATLSHLNTIKVCYERGDEYSLIIEDDIYFGLIPMWDKSLTELMNDAPKDWGLLQIYAGNIFIKDINEYKVWDNYHGAVAYLVNRKGMKEIVNNIYINNNTMLINKKLTITNYIQADYIIYNIVNNSGYLKSYTTKSLFIPNNNELDSTIHPLHQIVHLQSSEQLLNTYRDHFETYTTREDYAIKLIKEGYHKIGRDVVKLLPKEIKNIDISDTKLSLGIPCYNKHIPYLYELVESINQQSNYPDEIVISLSSVDNELGNKVFEKLETLTNIPIVFIHTYNKQHAGQNRNVCIENSSYDIISFIDADDFMHYQRIEIIKKLMTYYPDLLSLMHGYSYNKKIKNRVYKYELGKSIWDRNQKNGHIPILLCENGQRCGVYSKFYVVHGHMTIRRKVYNKVKYSAQELGEDAIFNKTIVKEFGRSDNTMLHINLVLSLYRRNLSSTKLKEDYNTNKKIGYMIGDPIISRNWADETFDSFMKDFPNSITTEYLKATPKKNDLPVLFEIVKKRTTPKLTPDKNTLLIHLRIGDVIDNSVFSVDELLEEERIYGSQETIIRGSSLGWRGDKYVKPLSYYQKILKTIQELPINKIILIGGYHKDEEHSKSEEYVSRIKAFFEKNKYSVKTRINEDPDEDFILMSNATYFVPSGGGYTQLLVKMVKMNNQNIFK